MVSTVKEQADVKQTSSKKDNLLKENLLKSFNKKKLNIVADVLLKKTNYSLRIIEWFISNYAKKNNTSYLVKGKVFNVYSSYKNGQLKSFSKKQFDLFRRGKRFILKIDSTRTIETTVAQLNFFRWAIENDVLEYVDKHVSSIKKDMDKNMNSSKKNDNSGKTELSPAKKNKKTGQNIVISRNSVTIYFD